MLLAAYIVSCVALVIAATRLDVVVRAAALLAEMRAAFGVVRSERLSDDEKEIAIREASVAMLRKTALLSVFLVAVFAVAAAPVWFGARMEWFTVRQFLLYAVEPLVLGATVIVAALPALARRFSRA